MQTKYKVYMHLFPNGKRYIGITSEDDVEQRWKRGRNYRNNPYFTHAVEKYGWDNIKHLIFCCRLSKEQAEIIEKQFIKHYDSANPTYGYNLQEGGCSNGKHSEDAKRRMSEARKKYYKELFATDEGRQKYADKFRGYKHTNETKAKLSNISKRCWQNEEYLAKMRQRPTPNRKAVRCTETGEVFKSIKEASECVGINRSGIKDNLHGRQKSAGGFHWEFVDDLEGGTNE